MTSFHIFLESFSYIDSLPNHVMPSTLVAFSINEKKKLFLLRSTVKNCAERSKIFRASREFNVTTLGEWQVRGASLPLAISVSTQSLFSKKKKNHLMIDTTKGWNWTELGADSGLTLSEEILAFIYSLLCIYCQSCCHGWILLTSFQP